MDKQSELADSYVEVRFSDYEGNRTWNEDFRVEVSDDADLQNEPIELKVLDYDAITANDAVGTVYIDLNPLLSWEDADREISGWFPLFDTIRGIRGQLNVQVKLQFFSDVNPFKVKLFKQSLISDRIPVQAFYSLGFYLFSSESIPLGYRIDEVFGFAEVLVNEDDPEYHWSDSFRTPRVSNESRQKLLYKLSGQVRRLLGKECLEMGGNALLAFKTSFDMETEESLITARAIGTAVKLSPMLQSPMAQETMELKKGEGEEGSEEPPLNQEGEKDEELSRMRAGLTNALPMSRTASFGNYQDNLMYTKVLSDQYLITLSKFPQGSILSMGGLVSARSVKLLQNDDKELRDAWWSEIREEIKNHATTLCCPFVIGYTETTTIHDELCVLSAIGTAVNLDLRMLSTTPFSPVSRPSKSNLDEPFKSPRSFSIQTPDPVGSPNIKKSTSATPVVPALPLNPVTTKKKWACQACHVPFIKSNTPFPMTFTKCGKCGKKNVPEIIMSSIEFPPELEAIGDSFYIEAHICRPKKRKEGESNAAIVSDTLPFIEYDLHRQLVYKLRVQGLNAIFGMSIHLAIGSTLMTCVASGTATYLRALPPPRPLRITRNLEVLDAEDRALLEIQKHIIERSEENRKKIENLRSDLGRSETSLAFLDEQDEEGLGLDLNASANRSEGIEEGFSPTLAHEQFKNVRRASRARFSAKSSQDDADSSDTESTATSSTRSDPPSPRLDPTFHPNAQALVVSIDDDQDEDLMVVLLDPRGEPDQFMMCNTEQLPSVVGSEMKTLNDLSVSCFANGGSKSGWIGKQGHYYHAQMITVVKEGNISSVSHHPNRQLAGIFRELYEEVRSSMHFFQTCLITKVQYQLQVPKDNEIHIQLVGMAIGEHRHLPLALEQSFNRLLQTSETSLKLAHLDDEEDALSLMRRYVPPTPSPPFQETGVDPPFVDISPLTHVPGRLISQFLGNVRVHFVKEELSIHTHYGHHFTDAYSAHMETSIDDGIGHFIQRFLMEVQLVLCAHIAALGGNAMVSFRIDHSLFRETLKNQAYGMMSLSGDVVQLVEIEAPSTLESSGVLKTGSEVVDLIWSEMK